ncbi:putative membrane protein [Pseudomonas lurida]|uniref:hypothetical protein n=1 Tax=Pseudomonas lurida TaxID=244566 RepID=UPI000F048E90|nr:hypothetical protein [Pseudomonas lurida]MCF5022545.1 hypothetical protein [Pseudomonas lurida]MCF5307868.1 hypothetical protein [Pseudomonas lurida]MCF5324111.1 hypothetical protein [Pseudomonas lurida]
MSIGALAALPIIGDLAKVAGEITKAITPLIQPFADAAAKKLFAADTTAQNDQNKIEFAKTVDTKISYAFSKSA